MHTRQDLESGGGICKPTPHDILTNKLYVLISDIPLQYHTAAGLIHPRLKPWYSAFGRIESSGG